jgi:hypothetical protein
VQEAPRRRLSAIAINVALWNWRTVFGVLPERGKLSDRGASVNEERTRTSDKNARLLEGEHIRLFVTYVPDYRIFRSRRARPHERASLEGPGMSVVSKHSCASGVLVQRAWILR